MPTQMKNIGNSKTPARFNVSNQGQQFRPHSVSKLKPNGKVGYLKPAPNATKIQMNFAKDKYGTPTLK